MDGRSRSSYDGDLDGLLQQQQQLNNLSSPLFLNPVVNFQRRAAESQAVSNTGQYARVLMLYTGGTIGMKEVSDQGFIPVDNYLTEVLSKTARFHDPLHMQASNDPAEETVLMSEHETVSHSALVTPLSVYKKRVRYVIAPFKPLLDSANMAVTDWVQIGRVLELNYSKFDAFVIIHGTDTLAYTASALSFMLEDLGKSVIITGSQVPLAELRTDAEENLLGSLILAGHFVIPEVCVFFANKLYRGNRCAKYDALGFSAFDSFNMKELAKVGINIDINWSDIRRPHSIAKFQVFKQMDSNVASLRIFPSIQLSILKAFLADGINGVVLETYGAGNIPSCRLDILEALKEACRRGVVIVNVTQCKRGIVSDLYATGRALTDIGVVPGCDMTVECALAKLSYLIGKGRSPNEIRTLLTMNLRGELTSIHNNIQNGKTVVAGKQSQFISSVMQSMKLETMQERKLIERALMPHLICAAAGSGDINSFEKLISEICDQSILYNVVDFDGRTALHIASTAGHYDIVQRLLEIGASIHLRDGNSNTPLALACLNGHDKVATLLVSCGATFEPTHISAQSKFHLMELIEARNIAGVRLYLQCGFDLKLLQLAGQSYVEQCWQKSQGDTAFAQFIKAIEDFKRR
ncbi:hypothetical protein MIR68_000059 [Amoeboaphelidium protococcarum]|nr:hypothetical protein MIR68_000059 [Amoeboaphelidium protococcarum]